TDRGVLDADQPVHDGSTEAMLAVLLAEAAESDPVA
ncbi:hypothetical protein MNBD_ACTINO01-524, partial [hydrothermal vent metagenome]